MDSKYKILIIYCNYLYTWGIKFWSIILVIALLKRLTEYVEYVQSYALKVQFSSIFISNFEHIKHITFMFFLLNLKRFSRLIEHSNWLILFLIFVLLLPVLGILVRYGYKFKLSHSFWITLHQFRWTLFAILFQLYLKKLILPWSCRQVIYQ